MWILSYQGPASQSETTLGILTKRLTKWVLENWQGKREPRGNYRKQLPFLHHGNKNKRLEVSVLKSSEEGSCPVAPDLWGGGTNWLVILKGVAKLILGRCRKQIWKLQSIAPGITVADGRGGGNAGETLKEIVSHQDVWKKQSEQVPLSFFSLAVSLLLSHWQSLVWTQPAKEKCPWNPHCFWLSSPKRGA